MIDRRTFASAIGATLALAPFVGEAQQPPAKIYRIGFLGLTSASVFASRVEALRAGLRELGYIEGKNIVIESVGLMGILIASPDSRPS